MAVDMCTLLYHSIHVVDYRFFSIFLFLKINFSTHTQHNLVCEGIISLEIHSCTGMIELMGQNALTRPQNGKNVEKQVKIWSLPSDLVPLADSAT